VRRLTLVFIAIVLLVCFAVVVYTAFPHDEYACIRSHVILQAQYAESCTKSQKYTSCVTRFTGFTPVNVCDVYSSPTPVHGWLKYR
jgi:hypothetical protein